MFKKIPAPRIPYFHTNLATYIAPLGSQHYASYPFLLKHPFSSLRQYFCRECGKNHPPYRLEWHQHFRDSESTTKKGSQLSLKLFTIVFFEKLYKYGDPSTPIVPPSHYKFEDIVFLQY